MNCTTLRTRTKNAPALVGIAIATLLLMSPLATAAPDSEKERPGPRPKEPDRGPGPERAPPQWHAFTAAFNGTGITKDNETYIFRLEAAGIARIRLGEDGNFSGLRGFARAHGQLWDANGTLVKEGTFRVHLQARQSTDGETRWHLESVKKRSAFSALELRGNATLSDGPGLTLDGAGHAVVRGLEADERATPMKLDGSGLLARP